MSPAIDVNAITKSFGPVTAVRELSFSLSTGEVLGFLGPNGAGKSTTMKMIAGFLAPDAGRVTVNGHPVAEKPQAVHRSIGYLPEGAPLYGDMTVWNFLGFVARLRGMGRREAHTAMEREIDALGLVPVLDRPVEHLSKGFKRRVGLAQALLHGPPVLVLDEPTDGLDPNQKHQIRSLIRDLAPTRAILISTHLLDEVDSVCTRAIVLNQGQIVFDDTPAAMRQRGPMEQVFRDLTLGTMQ